MKMMAPRGIMCITCLGISFVMASISGMAEPPAASPSMASVDLASPPDIQRWPAGQAWQEMLWGWYRGGPTTVVVDASSPEELEAFRRVIGRLGAVAARRTGSGIDAASVIAADKATAADLQGRLLLVGAAGSRAAASLRRTPLAPLLPLRPGETVRVMSVNPWNPDAAMMVLSGSDAAAVREYLGQLGDRIGGGWGMRGIEYEIHRDGMRLCYGRFAPGSGGSGRIDPAGSVDLRAMVSVERSNGVQSTFIRGELSGTQIQQAVDTAGRNLRAFVARLGGTPRNAELSLVLYPDRETKAVRTGDPRWSHCEIAAGGGPRVHAVVAVSGSETRDRIALGRAAMVNVFGGMARGALADGTALWLAGELLGRPLEWWTERLERSGLRIGDDEILDDDAYGRRSYLVGMPSAAIVVRGMLEGLTPSQAGALLGNSEKARRAALAVPRSAHRTASPDARGTPHRPVRGVASFQKGMSLSHEGYAVIDGYGSAAAAGQMRRLAGMGVDWIGLSPYGFMRDPSAPEIGFLEDEVQSPGTENDAAVLSSLESAHRMGLKVMLKPQIWLPRGHWTGDIAMTTPESWRQFFSRYREFLAHYALLAEAGGADLLVIGVELQQTTQRQEEWRSLIGVARALYSGPLTYAANWGEEFEQVEFWDALDHAGLDCYYPLIPGADGSAAAVDDQRLLEGAREVARRVERVARRSGRSVILTEVGFPALAEAWRSPHDENTGRASEAEAQARCYRAVLAAFYDQPWLAGLFWWKWPTTEQGARSEPLFSPRGNPAERVVAEWYARPRALRADWPTQ